MKVSVITVCKNSEQTIERAIQSIINQTYAQIEYIIVDGCSKDNTDAIINRYQEKIAHFISEVDSGVYEAMNKGIRLATGDWFYFVNSDDYLIDDNVIQDLVQFVSLHPDCDFVYGNHEARFPNGDSSFHAAAPPEQMLEEMVSLGECMIQPACFFKADLFTKLGLFDETYKIAADYEWFARLLQDASLRLYYYPRNLVSYSHGGLSSNIRALFEEVFSIQNKIALYQQEPWLTKRLHKLQQSFVDKYDLLERTNHLSLKRLRHIEALEARIQAIEEAAAREAPQKKAQRLEAQNQALKTEIEALQAKASDLEARIQAMESSKFWQLRGKWFNLKRRLGLPADE